MKKSLLLIVLLLLPAAGRAAIAMPTSESSDTLLPRRAPERAEAKQLAVPAVLIAAGALGIGEKWLPEAARWGRHFHTEADDYLRFTPLIASTAMTLAGVKTRYAAGERLAVRVTSYAIMIAAGQGCKWLIRERRPNGKDRKSFPSGHTATVFLGAELMRTEYGNGIGAAAYGVAALTAGLRLTNGKHYLNDVLAGAGIGILSARAAYWLLPWERKLLHMPKGNAVAALPWYDATSRGAGLAVAASF